MPILRVHRLAIAALLSLTLSSSAWANDVYIPVAGPMTGSTAALGAQIRDGATAAMDSINASGLLPDTKPVLRIADDASDPKRAVAVANRLTADGIELVVGPFRSNSSTPASDIYTEAEVIQISPGSTNPRLTERGLTTLFRICRRDDQQGRGAADYIVRHHQGAKLAVLDDKGTAEGIADIVEPRLRAAGEHTVRQSDVAGEKEYTTRVSKLKREGLQIVYIGYYNEIDIILRQAAEASARLTVIADDPLMSSGLLAIAGEAAKGTLITFMPDRTNNAAGAAAVARLKDSSLSAAGYTLYAYSAVQAWADSVKRAGSFDATPVAAALRSGLIETAIGTVRFDSKGDNAAPGFIVYGWRDNTVEAVEQN
ncbi:branched-chain amino acid ABC transporter substrate-binding protein [Bradyrhizobium sp. WSM1417]|uniref:branched-chain amino acid ABC transporter substrate-binding protein n=1 Tax=Bradyrhizobium sp. WSM1417 TaxID=754500 RepID=UPI00047FB125|nr:branched-chain amino acid ABC transporter substrate-binding protein [Bradyrhizobium sp. WSM1417]